MKNKFWLFGAFLIALVCLGCKGGGGSSLGEANLNKDASYALGLNIGSNLRGGMKSDNIIPDMKEFIQGIRDGISDSNQRFDLEQAWEIFEAANKALKDEQRGVSQQEENSFLAENSKKPGIIITNSGLQYEVITEGSGPKPTEGDSVRMHYETRFINGDVFESSYNHGEPDVLELKQLLPGWSEGMQLMSVGSKYRFYIPSALGFGEDGYSDPFSGEVYIKPFTVLIFEIELFEINPKGE